MYNVCSLPEVSPCPTPCADQPQVRWTGGRPEQVVITANPHPEHLVYLLDQLELSGPVFGDGSPGRRCEYFALACVGRASHLGPPLVLLLTPSERIVLHGVGAGLTNKGIARQLGKSEHTVKNQLSAVFRKLNMTNRYELRIYYLGEGLRNYTPAV